MEQREREGGCIGLMGWGGSPSWTRMDSDVRVRVRPGLGRPVSVAVQVCPASILRHDALYSAHHVRFSTFALMLSGIMYRNIMHFFQCVV